MNTILLTFILFFSVNAYCDEVNFSGVKKSYYPDGKLQYKQQFKKNVLNGYVWEYYPNGKLAFIQPMSDGKINGVVKAYYASGQLKGQVRYVNDLQDGISKEFYSHGRIKEEVVFIDGQMMSIKTFDEKGRLTSEQIGNFNYGCTVVK